MDASVVPGSAVLSHEGLLAALSAGVGRTAGSAALLLVELRDPPTVRMQLGYQASARLVDNLAEGFDGAFGKRGTVLRLGDTSVCVLVDAVRNAGHAMLAAEKVCHVANRVLIEAGVTVKTGLSIGVALFSRDTSEPEALLRKAQLASMEARRRAERFAVYSDSLAGQVLQSGKLGAALEHALHAGALSVHFQPKIRICDGQISGVEALMRWLQDGKVVATPDIFIPLAEQAGIIHDITWYSLSNSLRMSAALGHLPVAVNVTPGMLHHGEFIEMIKAAVQSWRVGHGVLTLELTEGALISDFEEATRRLRQVRELGVRVSIDDFGTGYSSLSYFKRIPADEIKIDKSFVRGMLKDDADQRLVQVIINLGHQFELKVVAEGVEDRETLAALAAMDCDHAQGHHFAPALDQERLRNWLDRKTAEMADAPTA